jgi:rhombotail lipoprotein
MLATRLLFVLSACSVLTLGCATGSYQRRASVVDYLYPKGVPAQPPTDVALSLPLSVGIAFAPSQPNYGENAFDERQRRELLEKIANAFRDRPEIKRVDVLSGTDLTLGGGFDNLDQIAAMQGIDVAVLISYEQVQFEDMRRLSLTYWTIVGAYVIEGQENETSTVLDASVFDIRSRALLFRGSGTSKVKRGSTMVDSTTELRKASHEGFEKATSDLIEKLAASLEAFREQARSGHVRGEGTPAVTVSSQATGGGTGAGATGALEALAAGLLAFGAAAAQRKRA